MVRVGCLVLGIAYIAYIVDLARRLRDWFIGLYWMEKRQSTRSFAIRVASKDMKNERTEKRLGI